MSYFYMLKKLWKYAKSDAWRIVIYFLCHILSLSVVLWHPYIFSKICNVLQIRPSSLMKDIIFWLAVYVGLFFIFNVFHRLGRCIEQRISFRARQNFINELYEEILTLPIEWHHENHSGNIINRVKLASDALFDFGERQFQYIEYFVMFWGPLIAIFILSYKISFLAFCMALIIIYVIKKFDKFIVPLFQKEAETQHHFLATFFDYISNIKTIITLRLYEKTKQGLNNRIEMAYPVLLKSITINQYKWATVSLLIIVLEVSVIFYYVYLNQKMNSAIMVGTVVAIFQYLQQLGRMFFNITSSLQEIIQIKINFDSIEPIKSTYVNLKGNVLPMIQSIRIPWSLLKIENLSFSYKKSKNPVLNNINLEFYKRSKIALVGESGSGKSTLLGVLRGMYPARVDHVFIDGHDYQNLSIIFSTTTLIQQEAEIFEETIAYNISVGIEASEIEIEEAIQAAGFDVVLKHLPEGLNTDIREKGVNLSGGEKQRLSLARGLLAARDSTILLLDEPTSSVDIQNEMIIYENIFAKFQNRCVISSIHRLHFLDKFDVVYVVSCGEIVQKGTFEELKQQRGAFAKLWEKYMKEKVE